MNKSRIFLAFIFLPLLAACAGGGVAAQPGTGTKYIFENQSYQRVWRAAMAAAGRNMSISASNEASGAIRGNASGSEEIGIFLRRDGNDPMKTEVEVSGGKHKGLSISSSFYTSPKSKNWPRVIYQEMEYELANMDRLDANAASPRPTSLRLQDMTPEMRNRAQGNLRSQVRDEIRKQMPPQTRKPSQEDIRAQIRNEVRLQMEQEMRQRMQNKTTPVPPPGHPRLAAPVVTAPVLTAPDLPSTPSRTTAPAEAPLPKTTLSLRERLSELKALYQDQLIGKAEYEAKKTAILEDL